MRIYVQYEPFTAHTKPATQHVDEPLVIIVLPLFCLSGHHLSRRDPLLAGAAPEQAAVEASRIYVSKEGDQSDISYQIISIFTLYLLSVDGGWYEYQNQVLVVKVSIAPSYRRLLASAGHYDCLVLQPIGKRGPQVPSLKIVPAECLTPRLRNTSFILIMVGEKSAEKVWRSKI